MLQRAGVAVGIITGRTSEWWRSGRELGIDIVRQGDGRQGGGMAGDSRREPASSRRRPPTRGTTSWISRCFAPSGSRPAPSDAEPYVLDAVHFVASRPAGTER